MGFSDALRAAREEKGYTQQYVAERMGITKSTYCGYETGKRQPDVAKIKQLSAILGKSADDLLETDYSKKAAQKGGEEKELYESVVQDIAEADLETMQTIRDMVKALMKLKGR